MARKLPAALKQYQFGKKSATAKKAAPKKSASKKRK